MRFHEPVKGLTQPSSKSKVLLRIGICYHVFKLAREHARAIDAVSTIHLHSSLIQYLLTADTGLM
ncbi:hypothetical protein ASE72_19340 [Sphingomonas sp. Leaf20]|nr:hypothetical protein ASE72_19340 [Sphingomonas sp. Leaf20]